MSSHTYHPVESELCISSETCDRCKERTLGELDGQHLAALGLADLPQFLEDHPQLHYEVMSIKAIQIQREVRDGLSIEYVPWREAYLRHLQQAVH